jgi:1,2-diacylglycerol 3-beta-galactosyltransferase
MYHEFVQTEWHGAVHYYNFVDDLPNLMRAADLIICKAGGLIVTEALAVGLPLLLVDVTPGQEEGNAQHVVAKGAGELADSPLAALEILFHWLDRDGALLQERAAAACAAGKPQAAFTVAEAAFAMAQAGPQAPAEGAGEFLPKLAEFLRRFESPSKDAPGAAAAS